MENFIFESGPVDWQNVRFLHSFVNLDGRLVDQLGEAR